MPSTTEKFKIVFLTLTLVSLAAFFTFSSDEFIQTPKVVSDYIPELKEIAKAKSTHSDKWIIVTSVNNPTEQIKKLAAIGGFQLLVIGDKKTDANWSHKNTIFLSLRSQQSLGFNVFDDTPLNSYTRKNIGNIH